MTKPPYKHSQGQLRVPNTNTNRATGDPLVLPPGTSSEQFSEFIKRCREICGAVNVRVIEVEDDLIDGTYKQPNKTHDMHHLIDKTAFVCSATIAPREVPEVQGMMRLCSEFEIPVWPFSIGRNTGYGGAAPRVSGSICLELGKHMNKILEVNTEDAFALLEPGVTYQRLYEYLEEHNLREKVWMDVGLLQHFKSLFINYILP